MKNAALALVMLAVASTAGCKSPGTSEDFKWAIECPKTVDKGSEFAFTVKTSREEAAAEGDAKGEMKDIGGVPIHYQVHWPGGSPNPLLHPAETGEPVKLRARLAPGAATIVITASNKEGLDVKVLEASVEVK